MIDKATNAGVLAYLVKPFRKQELQPAIELAVARYRELLAIESERDGLQEHIETRRIVGKARAVLARRHNLTEREAMVSVAPGSRDIIPMIITRFATSAEVAIRPNFL